MIADAKANGIADSTIRAAQQSPVYKFVKEWGIALPLHPEYRTLPNLFYVPPMLLTMASVNSDGTYDSTTKSLWGGVESARLPMKYLASLFTAGNEEKVREVLRKLTAVKIHRRDATVGDLTKEEVEEAMELGRTDPAQADAIFRLTSWPPSTNASRSHPHTAKRASRRSRPPPM